MQDRNVPQRKSEQDQKKRLAIVIPFRNRQKHLDELLPRLEEYCSDFDFKIFVVEQANSLPFNKGILLNIGFKESEDFDYWAFNDVDYYPEEADYSYAPGVAHLAYYVDEYGWQLAHNRFMGGVFITDRPSYMRINGFPNEYWGWGDEDNEIYDRYEMVNIPVVRRKGRYRSLKHDRYSHPGLERENNDYRQHLKERYKNGQFVDGYGNLKYRKVSEHKISEHGVLIKADFDLNRKIETSTLSIIIKDIRFKLGTLKRRILGKFRS